MTKGVAPAIIAVAVLLAGVTAGITTSLLASNAARVKLKMDYYVSDLRTIETLYKSRNLQEYLVVGKSSLLKQLYKSGGSTGCGTVLFDGRAIEIWKSSDCDITGFSEGDIKRISGEIAVREATIYAPLWGVSVSREDDNFCFSRRDELPSGQYATNTCFVSPITGDIGSALLDMLDRFNPDEHDCACKDSYKVCWDNGDFNFTYAVIENC